MKEEARKVVWSLKEKQCLHLLQEKNTRSSLLQIHGFMLRNSLQTNVHLLAKFIAACSSIATLFPASDDPTGIINYARKVFDQRPERNDTFICNTMMRAHLYMGQFTQCLTLYRDLKRDIGFQPDSYSCFILAKLCGSSSAFWESQEVHNHVIKEGFGCDSFSSTVLLDMYARLGEMSCARKVFDEMPERNQISWTALVDGYAKCGDIDNARELFNRMVVKDPAAYNVMINAYMKVGEMGSARSLFDEMPERNVVSWTSMVDGYCNNGELSMARLLFDEMPQKNICSWNAMIGGYCRNKQPREALKLFYELQMERSLEPNYVTIVCVLPAIADLGALDSGIWVHQFVKRKKMDRDTKVSTALVDMYAKCGEITKAREVFDLFPRKESTTIWNALINGLAVNGRGKEAMDAFLEMNRKGIKPNEITMMGVLSACNHSGLVEEGRKWFRAMEEFKLRPEIGHYGCMIDLLGRAGCLEEAEKMIDGMPYEVNGIILTSFLSACSYAKDVVKAIRILKRVPSTASWDDRNYIALRNLYATDRRWGDVQAVKALMRSRGVKKEVGCSMIEVGSRVWEFVSGDMVHPQWEGICLSVGQMFMHMKIEDTELTLEL